MNKISLIFILIYLSLFNHISLDDKSESIDYVNLALKIFESLETTCYPDIKNTFEQRNEFEKNKTYPWITDTMGKGINDIGDEVECLHSLKNTTFFMVKLHNLNLSQILDNDQKLMEFLEIEDFTIGFCIMYSCREAFKRYIPIIAEFINYIASNRLPEPDLVTFIENNDIDLNSTDNILNTENNLPSKTLKQTFIYSIIVLVIAKALGALIRIIFIPKGYDKYVAEKIHQLNSDQNKNNDLEEKTNLAPKPKFNEALNEESNTKEYNPLFDFSEKLPIYIRILRIFDIINDIHYLSSQRNRYYNDTGFEIIIFNRALIIFFLIFSNTFSALISLPSEEIINSSFFTSILNLVYRLSNNALLCWGFLEGAYTTYKLLCFITSEMFVYNAKRENKNQNLFLRLLIIYGKFLILMIPKIITFFIIFFCFYYKIEDFIYLFNSKATYNHIITNIFKKNIECDSKNYDFNGTFSGSIDDYNSCYEFTFFYFNLFLSSLISMVVIYLFLVFKHVIVELAFFLLNIGIFVVFTFIIEDRRVDGGESSINKNQKIMHYHIKGETYSTKIFQSFFGFYNLGLILGFLIFNFDNLKQKIYRLLYEYNGIHILKPGNKKDDIKSSFPLNEPLSENGDTDQSFDSKTSRTNTMNSQSFEEDSPDYYKNFILPYYPFKYINKILYSINKLNFSTKIILIIIGGVILFLIDFILLSYILGDDPFVQDLNGFTKFLFRSEKHIFIIVYFLIIVIMITLPRKCALRNLMKAKLFICINRIGFLITCISHSLTYITFLIFSLKVKLYVPTFMIISFGNFLEFFIICVFLCAISELPLRIIIKKLLRIKRKRESIVF